MVCVQDFAIQLVQALEFLHNCRLIHTDLKIENILLMNDREVFHRGQRVPESTRVKLIDFGGSCFDTDKKSNVISTRQYRAPEVLLSTGWSFPSDIWSLACILVELYKGELLFATHDNKEHLALVDRVIGPFPCRMVQSAFQSHDSIAAKAFDHAGCLCPLESILEKDGVAHVRQAETLSSIVRNTHDSWFLNLLQRMLVIDPVERATAHECLQFLSSQGRDMLRCV
jgi:serine/threonine protein kinase